ncbi:hypothetical protein GCM10007874_68660 [Labrys miyagiensis]|uniref:Uncharacterized protein n=2 Tax=Labrys miyagiensis TaxID=346912 RepID=A0ABQ6CXT9_9HYPH|nr:hypothetical protein GCM10007874_68660 [Labrys miyagiensis]
MKFLDFPRRSFLKSGLLVGLGLSSGTGQAMTALPAIPVFDAREGGPVAHARVRVPTMRALLQSCLSSLPSVAQWGVAGLDAAAHKWLVASGSAYVGEMDAIAALLPEKGVYLLNAAYEWGCTTLAAPAPDQRSARLLRTLDWNFDGLGRHVEVVRQQGVAGEYWNVTWPGAVGALTAMAPGRFAASINKGPTPDAGDKAPGAPNLAALRTGLLPSMHLLRHVFETAPDYAAARVLLERTAIAADTIFTLVGLEPDETCVIERKPDDYVTHQGVSVAANTWNYGLWAKHWGEGEETQSDSAARRATIAPYAGRSMAPFAWVEPPLRNEITRIAVEANPKLGNLWVRGYEATADREDSVQVTADLEIA